MFDSLPQSNFPPEPCSAFNTRHYDTYQRTECAGKRVVPLSSLPRAIHPRPVEAPSRDGSKVPDDLADISLRQAEKCPPTLLQQHMVSDSEPLDRNAPPPRLATSCHTFERYRLSGVHPSCHYDCEPPRSFRRRNEEETQLYSGLASVNSIVRNA